LAGAVLPFRAKEAYEASPGAKYTVNGLVAFLFTVVGAAAFLVTSFVLAPIAFAGQPVLGWLTVILAIAGVVAFLAPYRSQLAGWLRGEKAPWLSALGMIGGGFGMAMVVAFLLAHSWAFWATGTSRPGCGRRSSPLGSCCSQPSGTSWPRRPRSGAASTSTSPSRRSRPNRRGFSPLEL
ncbi:MAG: hypothetical protein MUO38_15900, partial [Anaerolineales bacterium]|nr:hypothetical protein [Anaerolineales bacterium]